jgi:hypothetical protein
VKTLIAVLIAAFAMSAMAQSTPRPRPPGTVPLEEVPPPPPLPPASATVDPNSMESIESKAQISTRTEGDETIYEYRVNGKLFMTRVVPKHGHPYVMIDHRGDGTFTRQDILDPGLRVPQWVLFEF